MDPLAEQPAAVTPQQPIDVKLENTAHVSHLQYVIMAGIGLLLIALLMAIFIRYISGNRTTNQIMTQQETEEQTTPVPGT